MQITNSLKGSVALSLLLASSLIARENPFIPVDKSQRQVTSNVYKTKPKFENISFNLSDDARVLKEITFVIQNLDGTIKEHRVSVERTINQHKDILISQSAQNQKQNSFTKLGDIELITNDKSLFIRAKEPYIRYFSVSDPSQIILDFNNDTVFTPIEKELNIPIYKSISFKKHKEFARLTITLDGRYIYNIDQKDGLITIECR